MCYLPIKWNQEGFKWYNHKFTPQFCSHRWGSLPKQPSLSRGLLQVYSGFQFPDNTWNYPINQWHSLIGTVGHHTLSTPQNLPPIDSTYWLFPRTTSMRSRVAWCVLLPQTESMWLMIHMIMVNLLHPVLGNIGLVTLVSPGWKYLPHQWGQ